MTDQTDMNFPWPAARSAAMVGADPARRVAHHVEGPTLLERELPFGRGLATVDRAPTCIGRSTRASAGAGPGRLLRSTRALRGAAATLAIALVVAGCGGAEEVPPAADTGVAPTPAAGTPGAITPGTDPAAAVPGTGVAGGGAAAPGGTDDGMNEIVSSQAGNGAPVKLSSRTPKDFASAHCARPIMVVLHQPGSILGQALLKESRTAAKTIKDTKLLIYTPRMVRSYGDLPSKLGLIAAPGVAIIARDGTIENFWTTYVDSKLLSASLRNASAAKACKAAEAGTVLDASGVPKAAPSPLANAASLVAGAKSAAGAAAPAAAPASANGVAAAAATATTAPATGAATAVPGTTAPATAATPVATPVPTS